MAGITATHISHVQWTQKTYAECSTIVETSFRECIFASMNSCDWDHRGACGFKYLAPSSLSLSLYYATQGGRKYYRNVSLFRLFTLIISPLSWFAASLGFFSAMLFGTICVLYFDMPLLCHSTKPFGYLCCFRGVFWVLFLLIEHNLLNFFQQVMLVQTSMSAGWH